LIDRDGASDTRLRLRMDYARTLAKLRERMNQVARSEIERARAESGGVTARAEGHLPPAPWIIGE